MAITYYLILVHKECGEWCKSLSYEHKFSPFEFSPDTLEECRRLGLANSGPMMDGKYYYTLEHSRHATFFHKMGYACERLRWPVIVRV
jgi:hypothetical protein